MEEIIIHTVGITRASQLKHFEIPLPRNIEKVTGLWYKVRLLDDAESGVPISIRTKSPYVPPIIVGQISLSTRQQEGVFYYGNLILENPNVGFLDYTSGVFPAKQYNRSAMKKPLRVLLNGESAIVHGYILDNWGTLARRNVRYEVDVYLFCELNFNDPEQ